MSDEPKKINRDTYLKALGLFTLGHQHALKVFEFERALKAMLADNDEYSSDFGHLQDEIYSSDALADFDGALKRAGYVVDDPAI